MTSEFPSRPHHGNSQVCPNTAAGRLPLSLTLKADIGENFLDPVVVLIAPNQDSHFPFSSLITIISPTTRNSSKRIDSSASLTPEIAWPVAHLIKSNVTAGYEGVTFLELINRQDK